MLARLRARASSSALVIAAIAVAAFVVLTCGAWLLVARDTAMGDLVEEAGARSAARLQVTRPGATPSEVEALWGEVAARFPRTALSGPPGHATVFSPQTVSGTEYALSGIEETGRWLRLEQGRLPRRCVTPPCEVVAVAVAAGAGSPARLRVRGVDVVVVGRGRLSPVPLGPVPPPQPALAAGATFLVTEGTDLLALPQLRRVPRVLYTAGVLDARAIHPWNVAAVARGLVRGRAALIGDIEASAMTVPDRMLVDEAQRGRAGARQAQLVAVLMATILAAFLALIATQRSRDVEAELARLTDSGARSAQLLAFVTLESAALALTGVAAGAVLASGATAVMAAAADTSVTAVWARSLGSWSGLTALALCAGAAVIVLSLSALAGAVSRLRLSVEILGAALVALAVWLSLSRDPIAAADLAGAPVLDPVLVLLPVTLAIVVGSVAYHLLPRALGSLARRARRGLALELALLATVRSRGRTALGVACLALALGSACFAITYRDALREGQRAAAAFRVGADARLTGIGPGTRPLALPAGTRQGFVIRGGARTAAGDDVALVGVPPGLARGTAGLGGLAEVPRFAGGQMPDGPARLRLRYRIAGSALAVSIAFQRGDGSFERISLGTELRPGPGTADVELPRSLRGARLFAVEVTLPLGAGAVGDQGSLGLRPLSVVRAGGRRESVRFAAWQPATEGRVFAAAGGGASFNFSLVTQARYLAMRAAQPSVREPVPAIVSPDLVDQQAGGERLPVRISGGDRVNLRIVGVRRTFPTIADRSFIVVDSGRLYAVANAKFPGSAVPVEAWLRYPPAREQAVVAAVDTAPGAPSITTRAQELERMRADPVAAGVLGALMAGGVVGALVSLAGLLAALTSSIREERPELAELEALGVPPSTLRRRLALGAGILAACGVAAGLAIGVALTSAFTALLEVGADGRDPRPTLSPDPVWSVLIAGTGLFVALAVVVIALRSGSALRETEVGRLSG